MAASKKERAQKGESTDETVQKKYKEIFQKVFEDSDGEEEAPQTTQDSSTSSRSEEARDPVATPDPSKEDGGASGEALNMLSKIASTANRTRSSSRSRPRRSNSIGRGRRGGLSSCDGDGDKSLASEGGDGLDKTPVRGITRTNSIGRTRRALTSSTTSGEDGEKSLSSEGGKEVEHAPVRGIARTNSMGRTRRTLTSSTKCDEEKSLTSEGGNGVEHAPVRGLARTNSIGRTSRRALTSTSAGEGEKSLVSEGGDGAEQAPVRGITRTNSIGRTSRRALTSTSAGEGEKSLVSEGGDGAEKVPVRGITRTNSIGRTRRPVTSTSDAGGGEEAPRQRMITRANSRGRGGRALISEGAEGSETPAGRSRRALRVSAEDEERNVAAPPGEASDSPNINGGSSDKDTEVVDRVDKAPVRGIARANSRGRSRRSLVSTGDVGEGEQAATQRGITRTNSRGRGGRSLISEDAEVGETPPGSSNMRRSKRSLRVSQDEEKAAPKVEASARSGGGMRASGQEQDLPSIKGKKGKESTGSNMNDPDCQPELDAVENPVNALLNHIDSNFQDLIAKKEEHPQRQSRSKHPATIMEASELIASPVPQGDSIDWRATAEETAEVDAFFRQMKGLKSNSESSKVDLTSPGSDKPKIIRGALTKAKSLAKGLSDKRKVKKATSAWDVMADDAASLDGDECAALPSFTGDQKRGGRKLVRKAKPTGFDDNEPCPSLAPPSLAGDERVGGGRKIRRTKSTDGPSLAPPSLAGDVPKRTKLGRTKSAPITPKVDPSLKKKAKKYGTLDADDNSVEEEAVVEPEAPVRKGIRRIVRAKAEDTTTSCDSSLAPPSIVGPEAVTGRSRPRLEKTGASTQRTSRKAQSARNLLSSSTGGDSREAPSRRRSGGLKKAISIARIKGTHKL